MISVISIVDDDLIVREATLVLLMAMVRAGRDAYTAGRDQTIVNYRQPSE